MVKYQGGKCVMCAKILKKNSSALSLSKLSFGNEIQRTALGAFYKRFFPNTRGHQIQILSDQQKLCRKLFMSARDVELEGLQMKE